MQINPFNFHNLYPVYLILVAIQCKHVAGRVWTIPQNYETKKFIVWNCEFPPDIVILFKQGTISINVLDMAGVLLECVSLEELVPDINLSKVGIQYDNLSTVHWSQKFLD